MDTDTDEDRNTYGSPPYLLGTLPKTPGGCLELRIGSNPIYTTYFPTHTYLWSTLIYKVGSVRD